MVKKLRMKFITISVSTVFVVLLVIAGFINVSNYLQVGNRAKELINILALNNGYFPKPNDHKNGKLPSKMSPEAPFSTRFFTVKTDENNNVVTVDTAKIYSISTSQAIKYTNQILKSNNTDGYADYYKYRIIDKDYGKLIIFVDCEMDLQIFKSFLFNSILICILGITAVFILVLILSKKAIAPVAQSYERQKRFITDASHELKTPLAIISANTEVIEMDYGENEWTKSTRNQVERLTELVGSLVSLTRMDEENSELIKTDFSLTDAVIESAEPFKALAASQNKSIALQVEKNISYCGNEQSIRQLVSIFLDNANKYAVSESEIRLILKRQGRRCLIQTINQAENLVVGNYNQLYERFYRADSSRNSQTGGYGIGLSIARTIAHKHKGKVTAESFDGNSIIFSAQL